MCIESFEHAGLKIEIHQDEDAESPRGCDNLGSIAHWHRHYDFGEKIESPRDFLASLPKGSVVLTLCLLDHSGLHMWVGNGPHWSDAGGWDSGPVGFIYCTPERIREWFGRKRITQKTRERTEKILRGEVETYDQYLRGDVYGYVIEDSDGNHLDSLWGMFGFDYCKEEAMATAETIAPKLDVSACLI